MIPERFRFRRVVFVASITFAILVLSSVAFTGLVLGGVRIRGVGLGSAGVLFAGIVFGRFGAEIDHDIAEFAKEFGLILFVFTIGSQLGPGIVQLWKRQGVRLNLMAISVVGQGALLVLGIAMLFSWEGVAAAGLFSGATTNTPSLGAAQQAAVMLSEEREMDLDSLTAAYAVAYPGGVLGIIATMLLIRWWFKIDVQQEALALKKAEQNHHEPLVRQAIEVDNAHLHGTVFGKIPGVDETGVRISRIKRGGDEMVHPATDQTAIEVGDVVQVVGSERGLARFVPLIGKVSDADLMKSGGDAEFRRIVITETDALGRSLRELSLNEVHNVSVTRILRSGVEMTPSGSSRFHYGDVVQVVGDRESLDRVTDFLGNSVKALDETRYSPIFVGIAVGVVLGMIPITLPGIPFPVRLGLAGGPLVAAIALSLIGNVGNLVWYIPRPANLALRELGIILFLASAGLGAGERFFDAITSWQGIACMAAGLVVTTVPLLTTAVVARLVWKENYLTICGVVAGSMTDPPALAFANSLSDSEASSAAYAAVYPLTMILRIILAQTIVILLR